MHLPLALCPAPAELLRKQLDKRNRVAGGGASGSGAGILNAEGRDKLVREFEQLNNSRANLDVLVARMGGLDARSLVKELKANGLKWGHLTDGQVRGVWAVGVEVSSGAPQRGPGQGCRG